MVCKMQCCPGWGLQSQGTLWEDLLTLFLFCCSREDIFPCKSIATGFGTGIFLLKLAEPRAPDSPGSANLPPLEASLIGAGDVPLKEVLLCLMSIHYMPVTAVTPAHNPPTPFLSFADFLCG